MWSGVCMYSEVEHAVAACRLERLMDQVPNGGGVVVMLFFQGSSQGTRSGNIPVDRPSR